MTKSRPKPIALIILDGWGCREETDANAIAAAKKPNWDNLVKNSKHTTISGSGKCVGLPNGQMGNSEVGHLNIGAGRIVHQDLTRIDSAIADGSFLENAALVKAVESARAKDGSVHIMGLLSPGGVHSHEKHIHAMVAMTAKLGAKACYVHAFLDGRDTPPQSALASLRKLAQVCSEAGNAHIASIVGRYFAMDRDKRWDRVNKAYDLLVTGKASFTADTAEAALKLAYERGETDEFVEPTAIGQHGIKDNDAVIFMNFRADRAREITQAFIDPDFTGFKRSQVRQLAAFVCLTEYHADYAAPVAFPPESLNNILAKVLSDNELHQLRIAETEKYAHVTFFFNGGVETPFPLEERVLIPSPKVATYDLQPEMSAPELTKRLVSEIESGKFDVIICNYANPDMVGHTGNINATISAIETIDACLGDVKNAIEKVGGELLITADHGNAEMMYDPKTEQAHTAHTSNLVPFVYLGREAEITNENGKLSDIAPTILHLLNLPQPSEMTGQSLLKIR